MATLDEALASLQRALGPEVFSTKIRQLLLVPGALEWLTEPPVSDALARTADGGMSAPTVALLAATGQVSLSNLPDKWPPSMEARRAELLAGNAADDSLSPDDVLILAGEILRSDREGGAEEVQRLLAQPIVDWRAPLAVAWGGLAAQKTLARRIVSLSSAAELAALVGALRSTQGDSEAAKELVVAADGRIEDLLLRLVEAGEVGFAAMVSTPVGPTEAESRDEDAAPDSEYRVLRESLQHAWERRRAELASLADGLATVAAAEGDSVTAVAARQLALQFGPSDSRLANAAISLADRGDANDALSLLPASPTTSSLGFAAGWAYLKGGAIEKGRGMLVDSALHALELGEPRPSAAMAAELDACGEIGLSAEVYRVVIADHPTDAQIRCAYARALAQSGDPKGALIQARLTRALDSHCVEAVALEADALRKLGRSAETLALLESVTPNSNETTWKISVECAIAVGDHRRAQALLESSPDSVGVVDRVDLQAKNLAAEDRRHEALALLETAATEHPSEPGLWLGMAKLHEEFGHPEDAAATLRRAVQMVPGSALVHTALARLLSDQGQPSEALASANEALRVDPREASANLEAGRAMLALGRASEAIEYLRTSYRRIPGDQETRLALATAYEMTGDTRGARSLFAHLPETAPAEAWLMAGRLEVAGDSPVEPNQATSAAAKLLRARSLGAREAKLPYWLGRAFEAAGDPDRAAEAYADFLRGPHRDPQEARFAALHRADCLLEVGDSLGAVRELETLRASTVHDLRILEPLSQAYLASGLLDEAKSAAELALELEPANTNGLQVLSSVARQTGDWRSTARAFHAAASGLEGNPDLWMSAAEASLNAGEIDLASNAVEKALGIPAEKTIQRRGAHVLVGLGQGPRAARLLRDVALAQADEPSIWTELADVAESAGDPAASIDALTHLADLAPNDAEVHSRLAAMLWTVGRRSEAIGAWQKALDLAPSDIRAQRALAHALVTNGETQEGLNLFAKGLRDHPADGTLLTEFALATLRHGSPQEAADLLARAAEVSPTVEVLTALGEAWLRLSQPDRSFEVLRRAASLPGVLPATWAVYAEASLSIGDRATAQDAIVESRRAESFSSQDRLALSRAEMRMANWNDALTALAPILSTGDLEDEAALAQAILRVRDARWLFGEAGLARRHAPGQEVPSSQLSDWLETTLAGSFGSTEQGRLAGLRFRLGASVDDDETLAALDRRLSEDDDGDNEPLESLAIALLRRQRPSEALEVLRRVKPDHLGGSWLALLAGVAHLQSGNPSLARQAFVDASEDAGHRPVAHALLARAHLAQGYSDSAISSLNAALSQWPDEPAWHGALADLYLGQTDLDAALPHLQSAVELDPENTSFRLTFGRALKTAGHLSEALEAYERVLPRLPSDAAVWHEAGDLALAAGDFAQAETFFDHAAGLSPSDPLHLVGKAQAALAAGKLRDARRHAESAVRQGGDRADSLQCLAIIAARQGEADRALELLDRAAHVATDANELRRVRTRLLIDVDRADQAAQELRERLAEDPDDEGAWSDLGEALEATQDFPAAGQALEAALRLRPRAPALQVRLARVERKSGQLDRALDLLRQAEAIDPLQPELALELGQVFEARRELDHALDSYWRSTELNPHAPEAFRRAGHVLKSLKAYAEAERMLERAAELDPTDTATLQQLAAVRALELVHGETYRMAVNP